jgi:transposase
MTEGEAQLAQELVQTRQALADALRENALLRQKIDALVRRVFGSSSEQLDPAQLQLLLQAEQQSVAPAWSSRCLRRW